MAEWNATVRGYMFGASEFEANLLDPEPPPPPPPPPLPVQVVSGKSYLWTIHPKRRLNANVDTRRHRRPFRRLSLNTDFRAWRRIVEYTTKVIEWLCPDPQVLQGATYGTWKATEYTYGEIKCSGWTYGDFNGDDTTV